MGKAILAAIITIVIGFAAFSIYASWINAPELAVIVAVAVMGGFIIYFNEKKK